MKGVDIEAKIIVNLDINDVLIVDIEIANRLDCDFESWSLEFDLPKEIVAGKATRLNHRVGSHLSISASNETVLRAGESTTLQLTGKPDIIRRFTDFPSGFYFKSGERFVSVDVVERVLFDDQHTQKKIEDYYNGFIESDHSSAEKMGASIIPRPNRLKKREGYFSSRLILVSPNDSRAEGAVNWLQNALPEKVNLVTHGARAQIYFIADKELAAEAYRLNISNTRIEVFANSSSGFFYAAVSLVQLSYQHERSEICLPCVEVEDWPRFSYRGFMLDCARHFHEKESIFAVLDYMAELKMNHFHWHLTDDEAWRIEIKSFPELTEVGAWRGENEELLPQFGSGAQKYGGFYSQKEIREIVEYAKARHIVVVPEIDVPGHSRAALLSLPELLIEQEDRSDYYSVQMYKDNVLNPALPGTYEFLYGVLQEVCDLFPGPYVHIGGDEVPSGVWMKSPACSQLMLEQGYDSALDLQGHLFQKIQLFLKSKQRQLLGWEEASNGEKLNTSAVICAWTGPDSTASVIGAGYKVIACPAPYAYLDMAWDKSAEEPGFDWAGVADLQACYQYEPCPSSLTSEQRNRVIGFQAVLWSELITSHDRLTYMVFPRIFALAETAWTEPSNKNWDEFSRRADVKLSQMQAVNVNHKRSAVL